MLPQDLIIKKRDNGVLSQEEIEAFVEGVVSGKMKKYQASALLMAIVLNGMDKQETAHLTRAMLESGEVFNRSQEDRPQVDKHSTGGVGDKVSLILGPLAVACGLTVPMISGRGLGHTGGTLDKLESIPGFRTDLSSKAFGKQLDKIHIALAGQTESMVPADRILYGLRDVTGTVESIPLISSSIMSKKLAEGLEGLVLDVKVGAGAFMKTPARARALAESLVSIGNQMGVKTRALITRMDQPLGQAVGNAVEVEECILCLKGEGPDDLMKLVFDLTGEMLLVGGVHKRLRDAKDALRKAITQGAALEVFARVIKAQGGDPKVIDDPSRLPRAKFKREVLWEGQTGFVQKVDAMKVARLTLEMGAGRKNTGSAIDPAAGISGLVKVGGHLEPGQPIGVLHDSKNKKTRDREAALRAAVQIGSDKPKTQPLVMERLGSR